MTDGRSVSGSPLAQATRLRWHALRKGIGVAADVQRLTRLYEALNTRHFAGELPALPLRVSRRMRTRLGQLTLERRTGRPVEIAISARHLAAHDWTEVTQTLLHEMVHVWQWRRGLAVDHGPGFRAKAGEVGVHAAARRKVGDVTTRGRSRLPTPDFRR